MFDYIDKLRKSPEPVRRRFVIMFSVSVLVVMLLVWGAALFLRIRSGHLFSGDDGAIESSTKAVSGVATSWHNFVDEMKAILETAQESDQNATSATSSVILESN